MELQNPAYYCPKDSSRLQPLKRLQNKKITYRLPNTKGTQEANILEQAYECPACKKISWKPYHPYTVNQ
jgi:uncharacterized protein with PIN domain